MGEDFFDGLTPGRGAHLLHDAVEVIFDGELGEIQMRCDFLVRPAFRNQGGQMLLSEGQAWSLHGGLNGTAFRDAGNILKQPST